jgi:hypothetical protein
MDNETRQAQEGDARQTRAWRISGTVRIKESSDPVEGVVIEVIHQEVPTEGHNSTERVLNRGISDLAGRFQFALALPDQDAVPMIALRIKPPEPEQPELYKSPFLGIDQFASFQIVIPGEKLIQAKVIDKVLTSAERLDQAEAESADLAGWHKQKLEEEREKQEAINSRIKEALKDFRPTSLPAKFRAGPTFVSDRSQLNDKLAYVRARAIHAALKAEETAPVKDTDRSPVPEREPIPSVEEIAKAIHLTGGDSTVAPDSISAWSSLNRPPEQRRIAPLMGAFQKIKTPPPGPIQELSEVTESNSDRLGADLQKALSEMDVDAQMIDHFASLLFRYIKAHTDSSTPG